MGEMEEINILHEESSNCNLALKENHTESIRNLFASPPIILLLSISLSKIIICRFHGHVTSDVLRIIYTMPESSNLSLKSREIFLFPMLGSFFDPGIQGDVAAGQKTLSLSLALIQAKQGQSRTSCRAFGYFAHHPKAA